MAEGDHRHLPVWVTLEEAHQVFAAAKKTRDRLFVRTLWVTGARVSEAIDLRVRDFDQVMRSMRLRRLKKREVHEATIPALPEDYCRELATYLELTEPRPSERLFPFNRFRAWRLVRSLMEAAGIEPVYRTTKTGKRIDLKRHPHAWRHGFAINVLRQGGDLVRVKELLGHSSVLTTYVYVRALASDVRPVMEATKF